jgi:hypothetical protein
MKVFVRIVPLRAYRKDYTFILDLRKLLIAAVGGFPLSSASKPQVIGRGRARPPGQRRSPLLCRG